MKDLLTRINGLTKRFAEAEKVLEFDKKKIELKELEGKTTGEDFWSNRAAAETITKEIGQLKKFLGPWDRMEKEIQEIAELADLVKPEEHGEVKELEAKVTALEKEFEDREFQLLFREQYDSEDAVLSVYSGAGGTDAQDWAEMVLRMMLKFAQSKNFETELLHTSAGEEAGIKSATVKISGLFAYGTFRSERGVHRLVRISPYDADHARHTSFALIDVLPFLAEEPDIEINPVDLKIDTFRAGGAGGQHVNTTDSAVRVTHLPTGIVVSVQNERSQHQNKEVAMKILKTKLHQLMKEKHAKELDEIRGESVSAEWGNQIRSYVLHPYTKVKDHRTGFEMGDTQAVLDGKLDLFVEAYLKYNG